MPQLRSCYFCGAVGDSLREYDLAPDDLLPPERSHSAVLCSTCHEKLRRVLEPLIDGGSNDSVGGPSAAQSITFESDGVSTGRSDEAAGTAAAVESDEGDAGSSLDRDGAKGRDDVGVDVDEDEDEDAATDDDTEAGEAADDDPDVPDAYYKVLRLLQNREFPMERTALTALVTAAYDVSEPQCERILETAIDRGVLVEDGSTLDLGRN